MRLLRNALFNLVGGIVPAVASLLAVPVIVSRLGTDQYGVFALVTTIVGYFAVFDINVTAGSVKYLSEHHARGEHDRANEVMTFGGVIYLGVGVIGGLGIALFAHPLVSNVFNVPASLHTTTVHALYWAALGFLLGQTQAYLVSVPQALQRYDVSGRLEGAFGALVSVSTLVVVLAGGGLVEIMAVRAALSAINVVILVWVIRRIYPQAALRKPVRSVVGKVASFSSFAYLARLSTITALNADKLMVGAMRDMTALSFYTVPYLLANRVFGLVHRMAQVIFPAASAMAANGQTDQIRATYLTASRYYVFLNASFCVVLCLFGRELLHYWAGAVFTGESAVILAILSIAVLLDTLTNLPSLVNDGLGHAKNTGIFSVGKVVVLIVLSYLAIQRWGILGAAWAQLIMSAVLSLAFVVFFHRRVLPIPIAELFRVAYLPSLLMPLGVSIVGSAMASRSVLGLTGFAVGLLATTVALAAWGWLVVLRPADRVAVTQAMGARIRARQAH